ncbi:MAG: GNAT family N-acetyltransferase [Muribaculaceae bacterium]
MADYRKYEESDRNIILQLWNEGFGDEKEFVFRYLDAFGDRCNYILLRDKDGVIGMVHYPVFHNNAGQVGYLYALMVRAEYRHQGFASDIITRLLDAQYRRGDVLCVSIPASESLMLWYTSRFGFVRGYRNQLIKFKGVGDFDFGLGNEENNYGIYRVVNAQKYLQRYAQLNIEAIFNIKYCDPLIPANDGEYEVNHGDVEFTHISVVNGIAPEQLYCDYRIEDPILTMQ